MILRRAQLDDAAKLAALNRHVQDVHAQTWPERFLPWDGESITAWFATRLEHRHVAVWMAEDDGVAVAYLLAMVQERPANPFAPPQRWLEIDQVAVAPQARRGGVARELVEAAVAHARELGLLRVELGTWAFNADALAAFEAMGFEATIGRYTRAV